MKLLITGDTGVVAHASIPLLRDAGYEIDARGRGELDLFDPVAVRAAVDGADAVMHLATHIRRREEQGDPETWRVNDRLRSEARPILVDAALEAGVGRFVFPSVAFVYPASGPADESTALASPAPEFARSALEAERAVARFAEAGRDGYIDETLVDV